MALDKLKFTKDWNNPEDFPTIELDETKVRSDMQFLYDEIKKFLNEKLIPSLENCGVETTVQRSNNSGLKYIRLNSEGEFETSEDGNNWSRPPVPKDLIESDVFYAIYGTTTNDEIYKAYEAGKAVYLKVGDNYGVYRLLFVSSSIAYFGGLTSNRQFARYRCSDDTWTTYERVPLAPMATSVAVTLTASGWDSSANTQTVMVPGILADETKQLITPIPAIADRDIFYESGILCTNQRENNLVFTAETIPAFDLTVYVTIQEVIAS